MDARPDDDADDGDIPAAQHPFEPSRPTPDERATAPDHDPGATTSQPSGEDDADAVWASIVARLSDLDGPARDGTEGGAARARTVRDGRPDDDADDVGRPVPVDDDAPRVPARLVGRDWDGTSQYDDAEDVVDDLEHFVPQDPGPLLGGDPLLTLVWGAATGVPVFLLVVVVAWRDAPTVLVQAAVGVFVVAVGILVWRMPHRREPTDDDDGAVV